MDQKTAAPGNKYTGGGPPTQQAPLNTGEYPTTHHPHNHPPPHNHHQQLSERIGIQSCRIYSGEQTEHWYLIWCKCYKCGWKTIFEIKNEIEGQAQPRPK